MWELKKRISLRISSVLSKVEPELDLYTGSGSNQKYRLRLRNTASWHMQILVKGKLKAEDVGFKI